MFTLRSQKSSIKFFFHHKQIFSFRVKYTYDCLTNMTKNQYFNILLILLNNLNYYGVNMAAVTCNPNNKIGYGRKNREESDCRKAAACFDGPGLGCYYSLENIPGFRVALGDCRDCSVSQAIYDLTRVECARKCLRRSTCNCFTYDVGLKKCLIKNSVCHNIIPLYTNRLTYNKHATKNAVCFPSDCTGNDISKENKNVEKCHESCVSKANCRSFSLVTTPNINEVCNVKSTLCDVSAVENFRLFNNLCLVGPLFPDWLTNHHLNRAEITDNLKSTCKSISSSDNFNLKIPWPTVGESNTYFSLTIFGTNIQKCINPNQDLNEYGVIAYVVFEFLGIPQFTGNFKACQLIGGDNGTECRYFCSCGLDYCEAVHIRAFASDDINMSICHYEIS